MPEFETVDLHAQPMVYIERKCPTDPGSIASVMDEGFTTLGSLIEQAQIRPAGPPLALYSDMVGTQMTVRIGFPVSPGDEVKASGELVAGHTPHGRTLKALHHGPYARLPETYAILEKHFADAHAGLPTLTWERYVSDPDTTAPDELVTEIYMPLPDA